MSAVASALASAVALPLQLVVGLTQQQNAQQQNTQQQNAQQQNAQQQNAQQQQNGKKPILHDLSLSWTPSSGMVTPSTRQKKSIKQINFSQSNEKVHLHLFTNHKSAAISDELTYKDSEKRLIILLSIIALCFLIWATSFLLIVVRLSKKYKSPIVKPYQDLQNSVVGFPIQSTLMVSEDGHILEFSHVEKNILTNALPNLKKLPTNKYNSHQIYRIYACEYQG